MNYQLLQLCVLILMLPSLLEAQRIDRRFAAGLTLGVNASQMDGDDQKGYNKFGIQGGLKGIAKITPRLNLNVELLYSQRGSKPSPTGDNGERPVTINLAYAETPFLLTLKTLEDWDGNYRVQLSTGFSYARLLSSSVKESRRQNPNEGFANREDDFRRNDLSWIVGGSYRITPKVLLGLRHTISLTPLLDSSSGVVNENTLNVYYLSAQLTYILF